ncbi:MAG: Ada metal-binding domain-containing protein [Sedimentisphaerales bacterium]|nr:Ada metal-binding domain-containing protein [Sedimentisphaerales bacterium]
MIKTKLFVAAMVSIFSAHGFAEQYPMLEDVRQVSVTIDHAGVEPNAPPIDWVLLQSHIGTRLKAAGIRVAPVKGVGVSTIPDLRIMVIMLVMPETEQVVFHIETSLYRFVELANTIEERHGRDAHATREVQFSAPVWTSSVTMQSAPVDDSNDAVTKAAMRQVELFINAHHIAVIKPADHTDANTPKKLAGSSLAPLPAAAVKPTAVAPQTYIASKNSKVFHLSSCTAAMTISSENLVTFASSEQALGSGRRPCKKCTP